MVPRPTPDTAQMVDVDKNSTSSEDEVESLELTNKNASMISGYSDDDNDDDDDNDVEKSGKGSSCSHVHSSPRMMALGVGLVAAAALAVGIYFFVDNNNVALSTSAAQSENYQGTVSPTELANHNIPEDCWLLIGTSVYDLTDYAPTHPGGTRIITDFCGTNGTLEYLITHPMSLLQTLPETLMGSISGEVIVKQEEEEEEGGGTTDDFVYIPPTKTNPPESVPTTSAPVVAPTTSTTTTAPVVASNIFSSAPVSVAPAASPAFTPTKTTTEESGGGGVTVAPTTVFISEIHYDNVGTDIDQFIEVAFSNTLDVSGYTLELVRGDTGVVYGQETLQAFTIGDTVNGITFASRIVPKLLNGPDGIVLIDGSGTVVEFISYAGTMSASDGSAAGMTATDIGVMESGNDEAGFSLQKTGSGCIGSDFTWSTTVAEETPASLNSGMTITCYASDALVPAPTPWAETFAPTPACYADFYDLETIAQHDTNGDCWHTVHGVVYDLTDYATEHGGGAEEIWWYCGMDTTEPYDEHHLRGWLIWIADYIIGRLAVDGNSGTLAVPCERRLEVVESGYWDYDWESVQEFEEYDWDNEEDDEEAVEVEH